tara:strand:+ start:3935 stop:4525 length:591 start_codon:yes stop_codon:yes gene_type:complete
MLSVNGSNYWACVLGLTVGIFGITATSVLGASAVATSEDGRQYAFCSEQKDLKEAGDCAVEKCGVNCKVVKSCEETGYGAVYQNFLNKLDDRRGVSGAVVGYSCGQEYPGEALGQAMSVCKFYSRKANPNLQMNRCYEKSRWFDPSQEANITRDWCEFAVKISGIKTFEECLQSARYPNPEVDCAHHAKQWCRKIK